MSTSLVLAIETRLQFLDRGTRQHQRIMLQDVIDVGADGREHVDADDVASGAREVVVHRFAVDHQHLLAEARSEEHTSELQSLMRISYAVFCLKKKKHKTTRTNHSIPAHIHIT